MTVKGPRVCHGLLVTIDRGDASSLLLPGYDQYVYVLNSIRFSSLRCDGYILSNFPLQAEMGGLCRQNNKILQSCSVKRVL